MSPSSFATLSVAFVLLSISLAMLAFHWRAWQGADHGGASSRERLFYQRQFRRRTLVSGAIGVVGLLMASGLWLESRLAQLFLAGLLVIILLFIILLAFVDMLASRVHFGGETAVHTARIELLKRELKREQERQSGAAGTEQQNGN